MFPGDTINRGSGKDLSQFLHHARHKMKSSSKLSLLALTQALGKGEEV